MRLPNEFEYYLRQGIMRKISPDKSRARFLTEESEISLEGLNERIRIIKINDKNANSIIKDCYDIIIEMIRAKLFLDGYSASGNYAHEAEISYMRRLGFTENEISFMNELGYFRNSVTYYGKILDKEYADKIYNFLIKLYPKLKRIINEK